MKHRLAEALLTRQFHEGPLEPEENRALRAHIRGCERCKKTYDQFARIERQLEHTLIPEAQLQRLTPMPAPRPSRALRLLKVAAPMLAIAAAVALFFLKPPVRVEERAAFTARSEGGTGRAAWIKIFRARNSEIEPLGATMRSGDGLLFAYNNLSRSSARYLMIVGLDAARKAHWYFPAYKSIEERPVSIQIEQGAANTPLKERVFFDYAPGPLRICGVFTTEPLRVKEVDRLIEQTGNIPLAGVIDCQQVEVLP